MTCVIIEDEPHAAKLLQTIINKHASHLQILGMATNVNAAEELIRKVEPELVFTDVLLHDENCFKFLERTKDLSYKIIFSSSHEKFAFHAFKYQAVHYLLKPIDVNDFKQALSRIETIDENNTDEELSSFLEFFRPNVVSKVALPTRTGVTFVESDHIAYCQGSGSYTDIHMLDGSNHLVSRPIGAVAEKLSEEKFCRVHKKYVVNIGAISQIDKGRPMTIYLTNGDFVHLSPSYKKELFNKLGFEVDFL